MPEVATVRAEITCDHSGSMTAVASQQVLTVGEDLVLVATDTPGSPVGCVSNPPCTAISPAVLGIATRLTVGGKPVLLKGASGPTNAGTWTVDEPGQTTLVAE
jgi:hypothetical protein